MAGEPILIRAPLTAFLTLLSVLALTSRQYDPETLIRRSQLYQAAKAGDVKQIKMLKPTVQDLEHGYIEGETLLMLASQRGHLAAVQYLLKKGSAVNQCDGSGISALAQAVLNDHLRLAEFLLKNGADANRVGIPPITLVASEGDVKALDFLLKHGADINGVDPLRRNTAVLNAIETHKLAAVQYLVAHGADLHMKNREGADALIDAKEGKNKQIIKLILRALTSTSRAARKGA